MSKAHYFIVTQTQEAGGPVLSIVPHQWVQGDTLMWPNKNATLLSKDAASKPTSTWTKIPCTVKRKFIPTFEEAEQEAAELSGISTDASDYAPRKKVKKNAKNASNKTYDFNHMLVAEGSATVGQSQPVLGSANKRQPAAPAILSQTIISKPVPRQAPVPIPMLPVEHSGPAKTTVIPPIISTNITPEPSNPTLTNTQTNAQHFVNQADVSLFSQSEIAALLQNSQELELDSQQLPEHGEANYQEEYVMDVQPVTDSDRIIQSVTQHTEQECNRIAGIIVQKVENCLVKAVASLKSDFDVKMEAALRLQGHPPAVDSNFKFKPASTVEEIQQMEKDLGDKTYQEKLIYHMRSVIGPHGDTCNGQNSCYAMIDNFFTRTVMLECSWSGGSKTNTPKYAIKDCKNILDVFFRIIHSANPSFSKQLQENFFKQVLRNSKTRCQAKGLRQPTIHRRVKRKSKKNNQDPDDSVLTQDLKVEALDLNSSGNQADEDEDDDGEYEEYDDQDKENREEDDADGE